MTQATVIKKISEDTTKKRAVIDVLRCLNGESYADATDILAIAGHFLSMNAMLDFDLARDIIEQIEIIDE